MWAAAGDWNPAPRWRRRWRQQGQWEPPLWMGLIAEVGWWPLLLPLLLLPLLLLLLLPLLPPLLVESGCAASVCAESSKCK